MLMTNSVARWQVLKDDTTLEDNKVSENGFMVVMVTKVRAGPGTWADVDLPAHKLSSSLLQKLQPVCVQQGTPAKRAATPAPTSQPAEVPALVASMLRQCILGHHDSCSVCEQLLLCAVRFRRLPPSPLQAHQPPHLPRRLPGGLHRKDMAAWVHAMCGQSALQPSHPSMLRETHAAGILGAQS
jgi:hypothetical protein